MKWDELKKEDQNVYLTFENDLRAFCGALQRACNTATTLNIRYDAQILPILSNLDDNTIVPTTSGLAGVSSLDSDAEMASLTTQFKLLLSELNTPQIQALRAKAAGQAINGSV